MNKSLAVIDHSFHQFTRSSDFFVDLLSERFEVEHLWDERWNGGAIPRIKRDRIPLLFWQSAPPISLLFRHRGPVIWVPMLDGTTEDEVVRIARAGASIVAFSSTIAEWATAVSEQVHRARYAPKPLTRQQGRSLRVFFWDRGDVTWGDVKNLLGPDFTGEVIYKKLLDPYRSSGVSITSDDMERYRIAYHEGHMMPTKYFELLESCNVFIAPRTSEGIGLSFLEAMARGLAVIAADFPTMNEYIEDGENGYLSKWPPQEPVDLSDYRTVGERANLAIDEWHRKWTRSETEVMDFIERARPASIRNRFFSFAFLVQNFRGVRRKLS